jgi:glycosyltransferase involved in cell wall biosynthesis
VVSATQGPGNPFRPGSSIPIYSSRESRGRSILARLLLPHRFGFGVKILNVIGSVDAKNGGTTDHVFSSSRVWSGQGHHCEVLSLDPPDASCVKTSPVTTHALGSSSRWSRILRRIPLYRYGYTPKLTSWLKRNARNYDAVILNGLWNYTSYGSWRVLHNSETPYYVCPHGMLDPWLRKAAPVRHMFRRVFWFFFERHVLKGARGIFFACEDERRLAIECYLPNEFSTYVMGYGTEDVPHGASAQRMAFRTKCPVERDRKYILFLSRIHPKKGVDILVEAFARVANQFPDFDLIIAGPDALGLKSQLVQSAARLGVATRIHWTGMLAGDEKWGAFRSATYFVLPSHQENFGIAIAEAMACALPVLITNKINIWREVQAGNAGLIVNDNIDGLVDGLQNMCALSVSQMEQMAVNSRKCYLERFDLKTNAMEVLNIMSVSRKPEFSGSDSRDGA